MPHLRQKIAQLICIGFNGSSFDNAIELQEWLSDEDGLGTLILFDLDLERQSYGKNIISLDQLEKLTSEIKSFYKKYHPQQENIWISIDVEGGNIDRLNSAQGYVPISPANQVAKMSSQERSELWHLTAKLLRRLNIDLNFAPVVDLNLSPTQGIFGPKERCFSDDPQIVVQLSKEYLSILNEYQIMGCLKHFPGHGSASGDTHFDFVDVSKTFQPQELIPFQKLCENNQLIFSVMTAHVINQYMDDSNIPATLSHKILTGLLRHEFNFQGIIISDDLQMHSIAKYYGRREALLKTFQAGADMVIFGNQLGWDTPKDIIDDIEYLVETKKLNPMLIEKAYHRVIHYKKRFNKE
jgi:beta-N-acetylhexosaminidase